ncbi:substrate-binding domain-containing protein [bacterium]|nr:substrate-binding domain-containing protein [bacterium]
MYPSWGGIKMIRTKFPILYLCLSVFILCSVCEKIHAQEKGKEPLRLVFITCVVEAKFFEPVKKGVRDAAQAMQVEADFIGTKGVDVAAQAQMVRQAVKEGYDGIALNIIDAEAFDGVVKEAMQQGVPVVAFNVDDYASPNARLSTVNQNYFAAGKKLATHLLPFIPAKSHVLLTMHDEGVSALDDRLRGEQEVLKEKDIQWTVLVTGNDSTVGKEKIAKVLRDNPDIRIILGTGQADTEAAGLAIEKYFKNKGYWSAGFDLSADTLRLIQAGIIRCTIDQQPYMQGFYPVIQLALYLRYGLEPSDMDAGAALIDRSNASQVMELTKQGYR